MERSKIISIISPLVLVASVYGVVYASTHFLEPKPVATPSIEPSTPRETAEGLHRNVFDGIVLSAKSAAVVDLRDGALIFGHNEKAQLPLASLVKLMTLATFPSDQEESTITIVENSLAQEGNSGLSLGERWDPKNLMALTLLSSSNDGAHALAKKGESEEGNFTLRMNEKAKELSLEQTYFLNPTGLDQGLELGGAYGSALDMVKLMKEVLIMRPKILEATRYASIAIPRERNTDIVVRNTNAAVESLPGIIASKTGFTDAAGGNLVVVIEVGPGRPVGIAVLGASLEGRFSDVESLAWALLKYVGEEGK